MFSVSYTDFDREIWEAELESFVPSRIFDAHCHLWNDQHAGTNKDTESGLRINVDGAEMLKWSRRIFPGRQLAFYYLGTPIVGMEVDKHDAFMLHESQISHFPCAPIVTPDMSQEQIEQLFANGAAGLKPYRLFASDPAQCDIADYLPESQMEVANSHGGFVTLHLSKRHGIADSKNMDDLAVYVKKYPKIKWILAHCARAFNSFTLENGRAEQLANLGENVWCDLSAVCDPYSHFLLMRHFGIRRILFGTDNIGAGGDHGKYITWGRAWKFAGSYDCIHCDGRATLVVYEQLRAMRQAADMASLSKDDVDAIFFSNASQLFDVNFV
ncbi:MAG: amidohydrolase family protein [Victivallales bacterium]|nr:amidohydrolase family protein [Victivallales bacterium]